jgi:hypothetical protein
LRKRIAIEDWIPFGTNSQLCRADSGQASAFSPQPDSKRRNAGPEQTGSALLMERFEGFESRSPGVRFVEHLRERESGDHCVQDVEIRRNGDFKM